jgi:sulfur dioxygenase
MIFRQLFDHQSSTYTYILGSRRGGEAMIIDAVIEHVDRYVQLLGELDLKLVKALDTHVHADHISGLGALRDRTRCITVMGRHSQVDVVSVRVEDGDQVDIEGISLRALYTPGHTDDSYCYHGVDRVFTGDTLLIRGTGRTDFQSGDPRAAYDSLFNKLLKLPDETLVYPAHDYRGETVSTIGEERAFNPRLQVGSADAYAEVMDGLDLPNPKMMDVAVPANLVIGANQLAADEECSLSVADVKKQIGRLDVVLVDLREDSERRRHGVISGSLHAPYPDLDKFLAAGGVLHYEGRTGGKRILFYCAYGERSALAVATSKEAGLANVFHLLGGIDAWVEAGEPIEAID